MKVTKRGFPGILKDNDKFYLDFITDALKHSDPEAEILLDKMENEIKVSVTPSEPAFRQHIIDNLLGSHRLFGMKIIFSKSLAISKSVTYTIAF